MAIDDQHFTVLPADDPGSSPDEELAAAAQGAVVRPEDVQPAASDPPVPFGRSWVFDWQAGEFVRAGVGAIETNGFGALGELVQMALHSARFAHPVFSDNFGMEQPSLPLGELLDGELIGDFEQRATEAILASSERITRVENFSARWDATDGTLYIDTLDVVTDEEETVPLTDIVLGG